MNMNTTGSKNRFYLKNEWHRIPKHLGGTNVVQAVFAVVAALLLATAYGLNCFAAESLPTKKVLIIYSFSADMPVQGLFTRGFQDAMKKQHSAYKIDYIYEYMDTARFNEKGYRKLLSGYLREKYLKNQPDLIVTHFEPAGNFITKYGNQTFPGVPAVVGLYEGDSEKYPNPPANYRAVVGVYGMKTAIDLILQAQPGTRTIYVVAGDGERERKAITTFNGVADTFAGRINFVYLNKLPFGEMLARIKEISGDSVILYFYMFRDSAGETFIPGDVLQKMHEVAKVPIYSSVSIFMGRGTVGGYMASQEVLGENVANVANDLLNGNLKAHSQMEKTVAAEYIFDWRELKRWGIDENRLPVGSRIEYREKSIWELYRWHIIGAICLIILQGLLIAVLLNNRMIRKTAQAALERSEACLRKSHEELIATYNELNCSHEELTANEEELRQMYAKMVDANAKLEESYQTIEEIIDGASDVIIVLDPDTGKVLLVNRQATMLFGYAERELSERGITLIDSSQAGEDILRRIRKSIDDGSKPYEQEAVDRSGNRMVLEINTSQTMLQGKRSCLAIMRDITSRKQMEERLRFLSLHDPLTGVYNRAYYEEKIQQLYSSEYSSVGFFIFDIDGLKLINDTLGHRYGDELLKKASKILNTEIALPDFTARIGGDEFAVVLFNCTKNRMEAVEKQYKKAIANYNKENPDLPLRLSLGWALGFDCTQLDQVFKEADNSMYRQKIHQQKSSHSALVKTMMKALEARDHITEGHADRLGKMLGKMGQLLQFSPGAVADLRLFAKFHDIGKVGIPDNILNKPGKLTEEEMAIMRRHSDIGFRIARSSPDLEPIADWILKHQEHWDGKGYPLGLVGEDIPIECRILAIVDAYDAMTSDRPYRKAMSKQDAIDEIKRCAGTQFDPELAEKFIQLMTAKLDDGK